MFETLSSLKSNPNFTRVVAKNKNLIEAEAKAIKKAAEPSEEYLENYEREMISLEECALRDKDAFNRKCEELKGKSKKLLEEQERRHAEITKFLNEEITINFHPINIDDCPEMSAKQMETYNKF